MNSFRFSLAAATLLAAAVASADQITQYFTYNVVPTLNGDDLVHVSNLTYGGFDPALGTLRSVYVQVSLRSFMRNGWENTSTSAASISWQHYAVAGFGWNDPTGYINAGNAGYGVNYTSPTVAAFDGNLNHFGPSGFRLDQIGSGANNVLILPTDAAFSKFLGAGDQVAEMYARLAVFPKPASHLYYAGRARGTIIITYNYTPAP
ncbi:MAG: choice-of-anchor E domain-containing protein [Fimbriimonadaceae bacterium]|nr:choice-of-anchor E domain-containing protein [Fimbriimonadaceae bacterium]